MKLKQYLKKKNYLMQLLLTIAGLVCIPLIIMQLLMMEQSTQGYSRLNEENIHENLKESTDYFARQIEKMSNTAIKASQDATIRKAAKKSSSEYAIYEAALKIKEYDSDDWSMGIWFYDSESILFNEVRISPDRLYEMIGGEDEQCRNAMKEFFEMGEHTHYVYCGVCRRRRCGCCGSQTGVFYFCCGKGCVGILCDGAGGCGARGLCQVL